MPWAPELTKEWQATAALATNEDWSVRDGQVLVTVDAAPTRDEGIPMSPSGEKGAVIVQFNAGEVVRFKLGTFESAARIWREPRP